MMTDNVKWEMNTIICVEVQFTYQFPASPSIFILVILKQLLDLLYCQFINGPA